MNRKLLQENYQPISLINTDPNIFSEILGTQSWVLSQVYIVSSVLEKLFGEIYHFRTLIQKTI